MPKLTPEQQRTLTHFCQGCRKQVTLEQIRSQFGFCDSCAVTFQVDYVALEQIGMAHVLRKKPEEKREAN